MPQTDIFRTNSRSGFSKVSMAGHYLLFMLLLPCVFSAEAISIILLIAWIVLSEWRIQKGFLSLIAPIFFLLMFGMVGASQYELFDIFKDVWYVGKVIVAIGAGYVLSRYLVNLRGILKIVVLAGAIAAVIHLIGIAMHFESGTTFFSLREDEGVKGYFVTVMGLAFMTSLPRKVLGFKRITHYFMALVCGASLLASFSRTFIISYILLIVISKGWARISVKSFVRFMVLSAIFGVLLVVLDSLHISGEKSLSQKFINIGNEVAPKDYYDIRDINLHWRGFESYHALQDFQEGNVVQKLFGQGLGATVDLGFYMKLGAEEFRYLPVLHNGYMYVFVKFGIVGLLSYLYFLFRMIRFIPYVYTPTITVFRRLHVMYVKRVIAAIGWCLFVTSFVIGGAFNKSTLVPALIVQGLLIGVTNQRNKWR